MIFVALATIIVLFPTFAVFAMNKKVKQGKMSPSKRDDGSFTVVTVFVVGGLFGLFAYCMSLSAFEPNEHTDHESSLQSLVQQAGGEGEGAYVRLDYTYGMNPSQVITYAVNGKLYRVDGHDVRIIPVKHLEDARVVRTEYFAHHPLLTPWYSTAAYADLYTIYVPQDAIKIGTATEAIPTGE